MRLGDQVDIVIGVDTHKHSHTLGLVERRRTDELDDVTSPPTLSGIARCWPAARPTADPGLRRCWAIEGTGSFGAGLTTYLLEQGERVVEIDRPKRPARRNGAKSDDARRLAGRPRSPGPSAPGPAPSAGSPRGNSGLALHPGRSRSVADEGHVPPPGPHRERSRPNYVTSSGATPGRNSGGALRLGSGSARSHSIEHRSTVRALRATARRIQVLSAEPTTSKPNSNSWSPSTPRTARRARRRHHLGRADHQRLVPAGRIRSEAAFAMLSGGPNPRVVGPRSSVTGLNRGGDRQLNRAYTPSYCHECDSTPRPRHTSPAARRRPHAREIKRCLKRYVARRLFRVLEAPKPARRPQRPLDSHRNILAVRARHHGPSKPAIRGYFTPPMTWPPSWSKPDGRNLPTKLRTYTAPTVLVIDDVGLLPIDRKAPPTSSTS